MRSPHGARARVALATAACFALGAPARGSAAPLSVELTVERAPGTDDCPDRDDLARIVARIVGSEGAGGVAPSDADLRALVHFSRDASVHRATLLFGGAKQGERTLTDTGPTCTALGRAVGITVALLLDAGLDAPTDASASPSTLVAVAAPVASAASPASDGFVSLTTGPALGLVGGPSLASGLAVGVRVRRRAWLELDGQYVAPRATAFDGGEVDVSLVAARLRACDVLVGADAPLRLAVCAEGAAGALRGRGHGYATADTSAQLPWLAAGGGLRVSRAVGRRWLVALAADALLPTRKSTFSIGNHGVATQSAVVAGLLQLSVGVKIW